MKHFHAAATDIDVALITVDELFILVRQIVVDRGLASAHGTQELRTVAVMLSQMPVSRRIECHWTAVTSDDELSIHVDSEFIARLVSTHLAQIILVNVAMEEERVDVKTLSVTSVTPRVTFVSGWHTLYLLHLASIRASNDTDIAAASSESSHSSATPKTGYLFPSLFELHLKNRNAIMVLQSSPTSLLVIGIELFLTIWTHHLQKFTLLKAMVLHVFAQNSYAAALGTLDELVLALAVVGLGLLVGSLEPTALHAALKDQRLEILLHVPVKVFELNGIASLALFGA